MSSNIEVVFCIIKGGTPDKHGVLLVMSAGTHSKHGVQLVVLLPGLCFYVRCFEPVSGTVIWYVVLRR